MNIYFANKKHPMCQNKPPENLDAKMIAFWHSRGIWKCGGAVLVKDNKDIIGFFRFTKSRQTLYACGTYVLSKYRKKKLAKTMWIMAIDKTKPQRIDVTATSYGATRLFKSLQKQYPDIDFDIEKKDIKMIVAFTGHRPNKLGGYNLPNPTYIKVCQQIEVTLKELNPEKVISGMALGIDQWAANISIKLHIPFIAAIPFANQDKVWPEESKRVYQILINKAVEQVIVCDGGYSAHKMQIRNEWMVDRCDKLIAVWDGSEGGTGNCVKYAQSKNKDIIYINPNS